MLHSWKSSCTVLLFLLNVSVSVYAGTTIADYNDLVLNSSVNPYNERTLNPGDYTIVPGSNINIGVEHLIIDDNATSLLVDQTGESGPLLTVQGMAVSNGTLTAVGGGPTLGRGVVINIGLTHSGGTINATGGTGALTAGIWIQEGGYQFSGGDANFYGGTAAANTSGMRIAGGAFDMYGGTLTANGTMMGSTVSQGYGMWVTGTGAFILHDGTINANGGDAQQNQGIYVQRNFVMENGTLNGTGGAGDNASGVFVLGNFTQQGGAVNFLGGGNFYANGMEVRSGTYTLAGGTLTTVGGSYSSAFGLTALSFVQNGGNVSATGGSVAGAHGMSVSNYTIANGTVDAKASNGSRGNGIYVLGSFTQTGGQVHAAGQGNSDPQYASIGLYTNNYSMQNGELTGVGGTGLRSRGVYVANTFTLTEGTVTATAGTEDLTYGVQAAAFIQNGGTIQASGSSADVADSTSGLYVGTFTQNNGSLSAEGGGGQNSRGATITTLKQKGGAITASGGTGANAYGLHTGNFDQTGGEMTARGGAGDATGYGMFMTGTGTVGNTLRLERQADAASVFLDTTGSMRFLDGSTLVPVVELAKANSGNPLEASGLIASNSGNVTIDNGAQVRPYFTDTRILAFGDQYVHIPFIDVGTGTITGEFVDTGVQRGMFLNYIVEKIGTDQYVITVERTGEISDEIAEAPCKNSREIVRLIDGILTRTPDVAPLSALWDGLDNTINRDEFIAYFGHIGQTLMPQAYLKFTHTLNRMMDFTHTDFKRRIASIAGRNTFAPIAGNAAYSVLSNPSGWTGWASPLYQQSSQNGTTCNEFEKGKEKLFGLAAGVAKDTGVAVLGGAMNYVRGRYDAPYSLLEADSLGLTVGGRLHDFAPLQAWFNPWLDFSVSYAHAWIDQKNMGFDFVWRNSSPHSDTLRAGVEIGNSFPLTDRFSLAASIGLDYTRVWQSGYTDRGNSLYRLRVGGGTVNSVRPSAGLDFRFEATQRLTLSAGGTFRYEIGDRRSVFDTQAIAFPDLRFTARGEERKRRSGTIGAGMDYRFNEKVGVNVRYDLLVEHKYAAHRFEAGIGINF